MPPELPHRCARRGCSWQGYEHQRAQKPSQAWPGATDLVCPQCGCDSYYEMRPLFIPLKAKFYAAFKDGTKTVEYRRYGPVWNEAVCLVGRRVTLARGYSRVRLKGTITAFHREANPSSPGWIECYGANAGDAACITIKLES
jgi:hypothetical protein